MHIEVLVRVNGKLVPTSELSGEQRKLLADWLRQTYLNELFRGRAVFSESDAGEAAERVEGTGRSGP